MGMSTSRSDHFEVLSLLRKTGLGVAGRFDDNLQFTQCVSADHRRRGH